MKTSPKARNGESFSADIQRFALMMKEHLGLILLCTGATLLVGFYHILRTPRIYRAQAVIQVEQEERSLVSMDGMKEEDLKSQEIIKTIEQNLMSPGLLRHVITENHLDSDPSFLPQVKRPCPVDALQRELGKEVMAKVRQGTRLIDLEVEDRNPAMAKHIAELVIKEYMREGFQGRLENSQRAHELLVREAKRLKDKLDKSALALQSYVEQTQSVSLEDKQNIVAEKLKELNTRVTEAKSNRLKLEADCAQLQDAESRSTAQLLAIASVAASPAVLDIKKSISEKEAQIATLAQRYKPLHPKYVEAVTELNELKAGLRAAAVQGASQVFESYKAAIATEQKLQEALKDQEGIALDLGRKLLKYNALNGEVLSDQALYEAMLKRLKESDVMRDVGQNAIRVVSNPTTSNKPVKPRDAKILLVSLLGGLAVGCGTGLARNAMDSTIKSVEGGESELDVPCLGYIPTYPHVRAAEESLVLASDPGSGAAEAFRSLRAALTLGTKKSGSKVFLFTSAVPGEGKSFCASNCALAFAQQGLKTLLIDADLRRPSIGRMVLGEEGLAGLADVIACHMDLNAAIQSAGLDGLKVLCSGTRLPKSAELLGSPQMKEVLAAAELEFDRIVIDSAPVCAVSDALLLLENVDTVCLVIKANKTPIHTVLAAERELRHAGEVQIGFVLNGTKAKSNPGYGNEYSAGYHSAR